MVTGHTPKGIWRHKLGSIGLNIYDRIHEYRGTIKKGAARGGGLNTIQVVKIGGNNSRGTGTGTGWAETVKFPQGQ